MASSDKLSIGGVKLPKLKLKLNGASAAKSLASTPPPAPKQDFLSWATDILSRPLYGITNIINDAGELGNAIGSGKGDVAQKAGQLGLDFLLNPGTVGTNPKDHRSTSQTIEHLTDVAGSNDLNYKNTANNVNPVLKGVLGFAGDIALDPSTYVPGVDIATVGKTIAKAGSKGAELLAKIAKTAKTAEVASTAAPAAHIVDDVEAAGNNAVQHIIQNQSRAGTLDASRLVKGTGEPAPANLDNDALAFLSKRDMTDTQKAIAKTQDALKSDKAVKMSDAVKDLTTGQSKVLGKAVADVRNAQPISFGKWVTEATQKMGTFEGKLSDAPKVAVEGKAVPLPTVLANVEQGDNASRIALRQHYDNNYIPSFAQNRAQGKLTDALGDDVTPEAPVAQGATETVSNSLERYNKAMADNEQLVRSTLGDPVVDHLNKAIGQNISPQNFQAKLQGMGATLDGSADVHTLRKLNSPTRAVLKSLGIVKDDIPVGIKRAQRIPPPVRNEHITVPDAAREFPNLPAPQLTARQGAAENALRDTLKREFVEPHDPAIYSHTTAKGVKKTSDLYADGEARRIGEWNTGSQFTLMGNIRAQVLKMPYFTGPKALGGIARATRYREEFLGSLRLAENKLDELGIPMTIGLGNDRFIMYPSQILDQLSNSSSRIMNMTFWNGGTQTPITNLLDAVSAAVNGSIKIPQFDPVSKAFTNLQEFTGRDGIEAALRQNLTKYTKDGRAVGFDNPLSRVNRDGGSMGPGTYSNQKLTGNQLVNEMTNLIAYNADNFKTLVGDNSRQWLQASGKIIHDLTENELDGIKAVYEASMGPGDLIAGIKDTGTRLKIAGKNAGAMQRDIDLSGDLVHAEVPEGHPELAQSYTDQADLAERTQRASRGPARITQKESDEAIQKGVQSRYEDTIKSGDLDDGMTAPAVAPDDPGFIEWLDQRKDRELQQGLAGKLGVMFNPAWMNKDFRMGVRSASSILTTWMGRVSGDLNRIQRTLLKDPGSEDLARQAWQNIQSGQDAADDATKAVQDALEQTVGGLFGNKQGKRGIVDNAFFREGQNFDHINQTLEHFGLGDYALSLDDAARDAKAAGISQGESLSQQWRNHNVDDPLDYINKMSQAFGTMATHQTLANDLVLTAKRAFGYSTVARDGFKKFGDADGSSVLGHYLPRDVYFPVEATQQIHTVDTMMRQLYDQKGPMWDLVHSYYTPLLDMWKTMATVINPSHFMRNFTGDASLQYLRLGSKGYLRSYKIAASALSQRRTYDGFDMAAALQGDRTLTHTGADVLKGRLGSLTSKDLYDAAADRGLMGNYRQLGQLETDEGKSFLSKKWEDAHQTLPFRAIGTVAEANEQLPRMAHVAQFITQNIDNTKKYRSMDELLEAAVNDARKWHPDGQDMTQFENKLRLVIPFYAWTRKAIPLIAESLLAHPARVNAFNKGSYNLAVATGVNPQSLSDPFPADQAFPSYFTDQDTGPQFKLGTQYFGIDPGIASIDVLNSTVGGSPIQNLVGQTAPAVQIPFALATGTNPGTGTPISDWSDFADSQVPLLGKIASLSGYSPVGTVGGILTGQGPQQQKQVAAGNKSPLPSIINYLTGLGITPMSQPNQIKYAQLEQAGKLDNNQQF